MADSTCRYCYKIFCGVDDSYILLTRPGAYHDSIGITVHTCSLIPRPSHVFQHFACNVEKHGKAWVRGYIYMYAL